MRARITKELILRRGFNFVAVEADWPDAARINQYIRHALAGRSVEGLRTVPNVDVAKSGSPGAGRMAARA